MYIIKRVYKEKCSYSPEVFIPQEVVLKPTLAEIDKVKQKVKLCE